jgi:2-iminobutanoate/2-iminopropanoate deaminase
MKKVKKDPISATDFLNDPIEYNKSFSRGIKIVSGGVATLFISGTASLDEKGDTYCPNNFTAQAKRVFANISSLLASKGACWHNVVQTRCYLKYIRRDYRKFNEIRNWFYKKEKLNPYPASVCIGARLCRDELLVEIEAIAILPNRNVRPFKQNNSRNK